MRFDRFLQPGDRVELSVRRHLFAFVPSILILLVMGALPIIIFAIGGSVLPFEFSRLAIDMIIVGAGAYYLFFLTLALVFWMDYYYDLYVVTNRHILDMDQIGLLSRRISHTSLARIQDVTTRQKGFWQNLLDFGPITIQTAGHEEDILLEDVPHCSRVAAKIMALHDRLIAQEHRQREVGEGEGIHPPRK